MTRAKGGTTAKVDHSKLLKHILHTFGSIWGKVMQGRSKAGSANDSQVGGSHYKNLRQQHWDRMVELFGWPGARPYFVGNVTAYVERYWQKNGVEDLKKAIHYLQKLIELEEGSGLKYRCGCVILPSDKIESFCPKHLVSIAMENKHECERVPAAGAEDRGTIQTHSGPDCGEPTAHSLDGSGDGTNQ